MRDPWAKLYMILYGDRGESGKIYLTPSDGTRFEAGKQYRVSVNIKDIGKVSWFFSFCFFFFVFLFFVFILTNSGKILNCFLLQKLFLM